MVYDELEDALVICLACIYHWTVAETFKNK